MAAAALGRAVQAQLGHHLARDGRRAGRPPLAANAASLTPKRRKGDSVCCAGYDRLLFGRFRPEPQSCFVGRGVNRRRSCASCQLCDRRMQPNTPVTARAMFGPNPRSMDRSLHVRQSNSRLRRRRSRRRHRWRSRDRLVGRLHLAADPAFAGRVVVVEKDPTYQFSRVRAVGGVDPAAVFEPGEHPHLALRHRLPARDRRAPRRRRRRPADRPARGRLSLSRRRRRARRCCAENQALQTAEGADILLYACRRAAQARFPGSTPTDRGRHLGRSGEGWFDGWALMQAFRKKARSLGVEYRPGRGRRRRARGRPGDRGARWRTARRIACGALVNAAGASGGRAARRRGGRRRSPSSARKRYVFTFTCKGDVDERAAAHRHLGRLVPARGHARPDGQMFICGGSPPDDRRSRPTRTISRSTGRFFEETSGRRSPTRVPAFEAIRPGRAWAGPYDMNLLDHNAIVGPRGRCANFYLANGFSGHGLQQSPAVGRGVGGAHRARPLSHARSLRSRL